MAVSTCSSAREVVLAHRHTVQGWRNIPRACPAWSPGALRVAKRLNRNLGHASTTQKTRDFPPVTVCSTQSIASSLPGDHTAERRPPPRPALVLERCLPAAGVVTCRPTRVHPSAPTWRQPRTPGVRASDRRASRSAAAMVMADRSRTSYGVAGASRPLAFPVNRSGEGAKARALGDVMLSHCGRSAASAAS